LLCHLPYRDYLLTNFPLLTRCWTFSPKNGVSVFPFLRKPLMSLPYRMPLAFYRAGPAVLDSTFSIPFLFCTLAFSFFSALTYFPLTVIMGGRSGQPKTSVTPRFVDPPYPPACARHACHLLFTSVPVQLFTLFWLFFSQQRRILTSPFFPLSQLSCVLYFPIRVSLFS